MPIYKPIGLMSGTSLDGLDIAYCHFKYQDHQWQFELIESRNIDYNSELRNRLMSGINLSAVELLLFHNDYGRWLGNKVKKFISDYNLDVDFIASHGHTIHHQPERGITFQLGSGHELARTSGKKVICDFRTLDVTLGGQGAPLVPIGDKLLFDQYDYCLNLGGIANISFEKDGQRIAYDIAPANMLLNHLAAYLDVEYDEDGRLAKDGNVNQALLKSLNDLSYYHRPYPKSLGFEWFQTNISTVLDQSTISIQDKLRTAVFHITEQIASAVSMDDKSSHQKMLITGGGAKNVFLIEVLSDKLKKQVDVHVPDPKIVDFKEAIVFAFMGVLRARNEINCLSSVTGASKDTSSGIIYTG